MPRKLSDNSFIWLVPLPAALLVVLYVSDSSTRYLVLQVLSVIFGMVAFHFLRKSVFAQLQSKSMSEPRIKNKKGLVIPKTYVYIAVMTSVFLFFSFMNYLSKALLLTIVVFDLLEMMVRLILERIKKSGTVERENRL